MFQAQTPTDVIEKLRRRSDGGVGGLHAEDDRQ
jgi:hypothetical protein